jgi:hypothetical protein
VSRIDLIVHGKTLTFPSNEYQVSRPLAKYIYICLHIILFSSRQSHLDNVIKLSVFPWWKKLKHWYTRYNAGYTCQHILTMNHESCIRTTPDSCHRQREGNSIKIEIKHKQRRKLISNIAANCRLSSQHYNYEYICFCARWKRMSFKTNKLSFYFMLKYKINLNEISSIWT